MALLCDIGRIRLEREPQPPHRLVAAGEPQRPTFADLLIRRLTEQRVTVSLSPTHNEFLVLLAVAVDTDGTAERRTSSCHPLCVPSAT